jgi:prepilin-type processing-associated H-X9-DG protein
VELLVVISIIALLLAILLPVIGKAQRAAQGIKCAANLRSILQGMQIYAQDSAGHIPGGANTSAAFLYNSSAYSNDNCPAVSQIWDWQAPIARVMRIAFEEGPLCEQRINRFRALANHPLFFCPSNDVLAMPFGSVDWSGQGRGLMHVNSYNTAAVFHYTRYSGVAGMGQRFSRPEYQVPAGYTPRLNKIGNSARKIFVADGARYSSSSVAPDMDLNFTGGFGGAYADVGAWSAFSNSWNRACAPGNGAGKGVDARIYAFRHGIRSQKGFADAYRLNAGFFDGHVETLGDLESANPELWVPRGTEVKADSTQVYPDVLNKYFGGSSGVWTAP